MKNLYLIPTDKPSRLHLAYDKDYYLSVEPFIQLDTKNYKSFDLFITSDEEIKDGDWYIRTDTDSLFNTLKGSNINIVKKYCKKVILTTDQDLIKDGIQSIDDEFLEWFVNNPSCEEVEIESWQTKGEWDLDYKIIIPKEEPKDVVLGYKTSLDAQMLDKVGLEEPKQETLEEAAGRLFPAEWDWKEKESFIEGAKWQQERMYSEEDMKECWNAAYIDALSIDEETYKPLFYENFIEQFKKK